MKMILRIYITYLFVSAVLSENIPPSITEWSPNQHSFVPPLNYATLSCKASGSGNLLFEWYKDGDKIITSDSAKYDLKQFKEADIFVEELTIITDGSQLRIESEGFYQCRVRNSYGKALSDVTWMRRHFSAVVWFTKNITAYVGNSLTLACPEEQRSVPQPIVEWHISPGVGKEEMAKIPLDARIQVDNNGSLAFSNVIASDQSEMGKSYTCALRSPLDRLSTVIASSYRVNVKESSASPPTSLATSFRYVEPRVAVIGGDVTLGCFFSGPGVIFVEWKDSQGHTPSKFEDSEVQFPSTSSMKITKVKKMHAGEYSCIGTSGGLTKTEKLTLVVEEKPTFLEQPKDQIANIGSTAEFKCIVSADPPANIQWFKDGELLLAGSLPPKMYLTQDNKVLNIQNVCKQNCGSRSSDLMVIQCNASNTHGYAFANGYLNVLLNTEITKKPEDVEYNPEKNVTFYCDAKTDPDTQLTFTWLLNDKILNHGSVNTSSKTLFLNIPELPEKGQFLIGKWTCVATNKWSNDSHSAKLWPSSQANIWSYWWVVLLVLLLFLLALLIICIVCCHLYQNRGDQYPVDEIEHKNGNDPEKELEDAGFHDYQRDLLLPRSDSNTGTLSSQDRTMSRQKRSQGSLSGTLGRASNEELNMGR